MRILHLGYEDPAQPGSGGGSVRTHEINRRLSDRHDITVLVAGYPGAKRRFEDGIHWEPLWPHTGKPIDRLAYFALLGAAIQHFPHDLVVEDFSAPFSTAMSPWFTRKPVIASVQWLFAKQMREKYHLPFDYIEQKGLQYYHNFITMSDWLSSMIQQQHPDAKNANITTVPNGIAPEAFSVEIRPPQHFLFVGRIDIQQKGCDLLIQITERAHRLLGDLMPPLLIVGDGSDQAVLERQVQKAGLSDIVRFYGRIEGRRKFELMAQAFAVLMPSRFETFGIVATESQACGAALIAFDVGPLKEVTGGKGAFLVPPFDLDVFAQEMVRIVTDQKDVSPVGKQAREWARKYDWDLIARQQESVYMQVAKASASRVHYASRKKIISDGEKLLNKTLERNALNQQIYESIARKVMLNQNEHVSSAQPGERERKVARKNHVGLEWILHYPNAPELQAQEWERHHSFQIALKETSDLFHKKAIPHIYIKFRKHYRYYDSNVDLLVRREQWRHAIAVLKEDGYSGHVMFKEPDKIMFSKPEKTVSVHLHPGVTWNGVRYFDEQDLWEHSRPSADYPAQEMNESYDFLINLAHNVFENYEISIGDILYFQRHLQSYSLDFARMEEVAASNGWRYGYQQSLAQVMEIIKAWEEAKQSGEILPRLLAYPYPISMSVLAGAFSERIASNLSGRRFGPALREVYAYPSFYVLKRRHELPILNQLKGN